MTCRWCGTQVWDKQDGKTSVGAGSSSRWYSLGVLVFQRPREEGSGQGRSARENGRVGRYSAGHEGREARTKAGGIIAAIADAAPLTTLGQCGEICSSQSVGVAIDSHLFSTRTDSRAPLASKHICCVRFLGPIWRSSHIAMTFPFSGISPSTMLHNGVTWLQ